MTFAGALSNAISGMNAAQTAIQVRGHNIANATTPGFARREVTLDPRGPSGGVVVSAVVTAEAGRLRDLSLSASAGEAGMQARAEAAEAISGLFGLPGETEGMYAAYGRFTRALDDLAATPESSSYQAALLSSAEDLSRTFNRLGDQAQGMRAQADADIAAGVASVNRALVQLHELNARAGDGQGLSDLPEQRRKLIDEVASFLDVRVRTDDTGRVSIATKEGVPLLGDQPRLLSFSPAGVVDAEASMGNGVRSGLSAGGIDLTPGAVQGVGAGRLAGLFAVRDEQAPAFAARLDAVAEDLAARLAGADADAGGQGLLTLTAGPGSASTLAVNAAVDPNQGGALYRLRDGLQATAPGFAASEGVLPALRNALAAGLANPAATGGPAAVSVQGGMEALASSLGTEKLQADAMRDAAWGAARTLADKVLAETGVNTDQELQSLLLIEQAYAANARVVQAVSDMMARLLEI